MDVYERTIATQYIQTNAPDSILEQFANITATISEYKQKTESKNVTEQDKIEYLNGAYNSVNIINKFLALILDNPETLKNIKPIPKNQQQNNSNTTVQQQNKPEPKKKEPEEQSIEEYLVEELEEEDNNIAPVDIITEELNSWNISSETFGYKCLVTLADIRPWTNKEYSGKDLINKIAPKLNKRNSVVASSIVTLIRKADFCNTVYLPVLKEMDRQDITKEFLVMQLYDFVKES